MLGRRLEDFAPALQALDDFSEMVISIIHPLVQVYTIPKTGELAYIGHVCNFKQDVKKFWKKVPLRPEDMPVVMVRPRPGAGAQSKDVRPRRSFKVDVAHLRAAFVWLRKHNAFFAATCLAHLAFLVFIVASTCGSD